MGKPFVRRALALAVFVGGAAHAQMPTAWNSASVTTGVDYVTTGTGNMTWSNTAVWSGGVAPNTAGKTVSLDPRVSGQSTTVTVDGTYTVGSMTSRPDNREIYFTGAGKLIFDNGANPAVWNLNSRITRYTTLRSDINIDIQLNSNLDIRMGNARSDEAGNGRIGKVISGTGKLTLTLGQNDAATNRLFKIGNGGTNSYQGGTEIRHIAAISGTGEYGAGFGSQTATLLVNALSTGTFGTGDVVLNSQGLDQTAVTALNAANGGLQLKLSANNVMGSTAKLTQSGNGAGLVLLEATQQTLAGLETTGTSTVQGRKRISSLAGAALTLNTQSSATYSYGGIISGFTSITVDGLGTQVFTNDNTYTGGTTITGGVLSSNSATALGGSGTISMNGGTLRFGNAAGAVDYSSRIRIEDGKTATFNTYGNDVTFANALGVGTLKTGALTKSGNGTLVLNGTNTYSGITTVSAGTLSIAADANLGNAPLSFTANQLTIAQGGILAVTTGFTMPTTRGITVSSGTGNGVIDLAAGQTLTIQGGIVKNGTTLELKGGSGSIFNIGGVISGSSANSDLLVNGGTVNLDNANTYDGPTSVINGGTLNANVAGALPVSPRSAMNLDDSGSGSSWLVLGANQVVASLNGASTSKVNLNSYTLTVGSASGTSTFLGQISGTGGLTKDNGSTLVLGGVNNYSGTTTISGGTLSLSGSGSIGSSALINVGSGAELDVTGLTPAGWTVGSGQTLSGVGTIDAGSATTTIEGVLEPGNSIGTLNFTGNLVLDGSAIMQIDPMGPSADLVNVSGDLTYGGALIVSLLNAYTFTAADAGKSFDLFDWGGALLTGSFGSISLPDVSGAGLAWVNNLGANGSLALQLNAIPEPITWLPGGLLCAGLFLRRRKP